MQNEKFFNQVEIDPEVHTLIWPNGADFDPATLHDWPEHITEMKKMAGRSVRAGERMGGNGE
ncbi:MAG: DUF2442 domain-containing protein [Chloroflexi bacterium]|nr:DUF2442 domain-containing protein [Chloroflexota bacterium]